MQPHLGRFLIALILLSSLTGCHGHNRVSSDDGGGLVNVRTRNGVHVRAPFVNVDVAKGNSEERVVVSPSSDISEGFPANDISQLGP